MEKYSFCLNILIARHMARVYCENQTLAITRAARRVRSYTRDAKMYELAGFYAREIAPANVNGKRLTGDELKIMSVTNLERDMRIAGLLDE